MTTRYVDLDFETASSADLKMVGADVYAEDPTTEILCLVYDDDYGEHVWFPGRPIEHLMVLATDQDIMFVAHNAAFEQAIWRYIMVPDFGFPPIPVERWEDTMAVAAWMSLPLKLETLLKFLHLPIQKDMEGNRLTLSMSRLDKKTQMYPPCDPSTRERIIEYCKVDVRAEKLVRQTLGLLSAAP